MTRALDRTLASLADPTRRGVVDLLRKRPRRAGELAEALDVSAPIMSRHLRNLREHHLIEEERDPLDARARVFRLRRKQFVQLQAWLDQVQASWNEQLGSFKRHAERSKARPGR